MSGYEYAAGKPTPTPDRRQCASEVFGGRLAGRTIGPHAATRDERGIAVVDNGGADR
jgi:hypothetical protein